MIKRKYIKVNREDDESSGITTFRASVYPRSEYIISTELIEGVCTGGKNLNDEIKSRTIEELYYFIYGDYEKILNELFHELSLQR